MNTLKHYLVLGLFSFVSVLLCGQTKVEKEVIERADKAFIGGEYLEALEDYRLLLSNSPENLDYNFRYGACLLASDEPVSDAVKHLSYAASNGCEDVRVFHFLGKAYHLDYRFSDALVSYGRFEQKADSKVKNEYSHNSRLMVMAENGKQLLSSMKDIRVMEKTESTIGDFFRNYGLEEVGGNVITVPDELLTSADRKKGHRPLMYYREDMSMLFFSSYGRNGDNLDIYTVSPLPDGSFSTPMLLGNGVNTPFDEDYPFLHSDGRTLYFSSKGHSSMGGYDIFSSSRDLSTGGFNEAENLDFAISSPDDDFFYVVDKDRETAYFASSRNSEDGRLHVYKVRVKASDSELALVVGNIKNETGGMSAASIKVMDARTNELIGTYSTDTNGDYMIDLPGQGKYKFFIDIADSELTHTGLVDIPSFGSVKAFKQEMSLTEVGAQEKLVITNRFDEDLDVDVLALAQQVLKDKAKLEVNTSEEEVLAEETEAEVFEPGDILAESGFQRDGEIKDIMELAYEQERSMTEALARDEEESRLARSIAAEAMSRSEVALKDLDTFMQLYETTSDEETKEEFLIEAALARQDASSSLREMISALTLARSITDQTTERKQLKEELTGRNSVMEDALEKELASELVGVFKDVKTKDDRGMDVLDAMDVTAMEAADKKQEADKLAAVVKTTQRRRDEALAAIESKELQREKATKRKDREIVDQEILALESELDDYRRQLERDVPKLEAFKEDDRSWSSAVQLLERIRLEPDELPLAEEDWGLVQLDEKKSSLTTSLEEHSISDKELARIIASRPDLTGKYDVAALEIRMPEEDASSTTLMDIAEQLNDTESSGEREAEQDSVVEESLQSSDSIDGEDLISTTTDSVNELQDDPEDLAVEETENNQTDFIDGNDEQSSEVSLADDRSDSESLAEGRGYEQETTDLDEQRDDLRNGEVAELENVEGSEDEQSTETRRVTDDSVGSLNDINETSDELVEDNRNLSLDEESSGSVPAEDDSLFELDDRIEDDSAFLSNSYQEDLSEWQSMGAEAVEFFISEMPDAENLEVLALQPDRSERLEVIWSSSTDESQRSAAVQELDSELFELVSVGQESTDAGISTASETAATQSWLESRYEDLDILASDDMIARSSVDEDEIDGSQLDRDVPITDERIIALDENSRDRLVDLAEEADFKEATESHLLGLEELIGSSPIPIAAIEDRMDRHVQFRNLLSELKAERSVLADRTDSSEEVERIGRQIEALDAMVVQKEQQMREELQLWQEKAGLYLTELQREEVMDQGGVYLKSIDSLVQLEADDRIVESTNDQTLDSDSAIEESVSEIKSNTDVLDVGDENLDIEGHDESSEPTSAEIVDKGVQESIETTEVSELVDESSDSTGEESQEEVLATDFQVGAQGLLSAFFDDLHPLHAIDTHIERLYYSDDFGLITDGIGPPPEIETPISTADVSAEVTTLEALGSQGALAIERRLASLEVNEEDQVRLTEVQGIYEEAVELRRSAGALQDEKERRPLLRAAVLMEMTALDALDELREKQEFVESGGSVEDFTYRSDISPDIHRAEEQIGEAIGKEDDSLTIAASQEDVSIDTSEELLPLDEVDITLPEELDALEVPGREAVMNDYKGVATALTNADILPMLPLDDALELMEVDRASITVSRAEGLSERDAEVLEDIRFETKRLDEYEAQLKEDRSNYVDALEERQRRWAEVVDVLDSDPKNNRAKKDQSRLLDEIQVIRSYLLSSEEDLEEIAIRRSGLVDEEDAYLAEKALALSENASNEDKELSKEDAPVIEIKDDFSDIELEEELAETIRSTSSEESADNTNDTAAEDSGSDEFRASDDSGISLDRGEEVESETPSVEPVFTASIPESAPVSLEANILRITDATDSSPRERKEYDRIPDGLVYQVQVGAFRNLVSPGLFAEFQPIITEELPSGITRYKAGLFLDEGSAQQAKKTIRGMGYSDAFIVVYLDGKRISLTEARASASPDLVVESTVDESRSSYSGTIEEDFADAENDVLESIDTPDSTLKARASDSEEQGPRVAVEEPVGKEDGSYYDLVPDAAPATQVETVKGLFYTVQVGVYSKPVTSDNIFDIAPLNSELMDNGLIKYTSGIFDDIELARTWKDQVVVKGVGDAFVTAYLDGKRIPLDKAVSLYLDKGQEVFASVDSLDALDRDREAEAVWSMIATSDLFSEDMEKYVSFKIRLGPYYERIPDRDVKVILDFEDRVSFSERADGGIDYTTLGEMTYEEAQGWRKAFLERGVTSATIVALKDGEEIPLKQALEFLLK